jgi:RNA-directed DNA polymerase
VAGPKINQVSVTLSKSPTQLALEFAALNDFDDISVLLEVSARQLHYYTHDGAQYKAIILKKKHGGVRLIQAPATPLKLIQKKLNQVLQAVYSPSSVAHGFVRDRDIVSNAGEHSPSRYILNVDLENFFDSITFPRVRGMFMSKPYSRNATVATILTRLCCYHNVLPQGAPTSPVVSNMLLGRMDSQLKSFARAHKCVYTRYADDLTFSTFVKQFPRALAQFAEDEVGGGLTVGTPLSDLIKSNGFSLNAKKSRLQHSSGRQVVTGLTANRFPNVSQEFVRQIRAMLFAWKKFGAPAAADHFFKSYDYKERAPASPAELFVTIVKGKIDYLGMVRGPQSRAHLSLLEKYATLNPTYKWPAALPPRELKLDILETAIFAVEGSTSQGTAFNLSSFGLITCAHVVINQKNIVVSRQGDLNKNPVAVVHIDEDRDLALLAFSNPPVSAIPRFEVAAEAARKGDQVILMGYPTCGPAISSSMEKGAVTGHYVRFGQARHSISCTILQGSSGGPVLDRNYRLIGVAANGKSKLDKKGDELYGVIPITALAEFLVAVPKIWTVLSSIHFSRGLLL